MVDRASSKQRRVSYSSNCAKIIACASADDRGYYFKMSLSSIFPENTFRSTVVVDTKELHDTITTIHEGLE